MQEMIEKYKKLVYSIANMYKDYGNFEDLTQAGFIGLFAAYKKYDSSKDTKFSTFAYPYILGEISNCARTYRPIKISKEILSMANKIEKAKSYLAQEYERYPNDIEVMKYLSIDKNIYSDAVMSSDMLYSFDYVYNDSDTSFYETLGKSLDLDTMIMLKEELSHMPKLDQKIFLSYYLYNFTQQEIANELGLNQVAVSRNYKKTLKKIKADIC